MRRFQGVPGLVVGLIVLLLAIGIGVWVTGNTSDAPPAGEAGEEREDPATEAQDAALDRAEEAGEAREERREEAQERREERREEAADSSGSG